MRAEPYEITSQVMSVRCVVTVMVARQTHGVGEAETPGEGIHTLGSIGERTERSGENRLSITFLSLTKNNLGGRKTYLVYTSGLQFIFQGSQGRNASSWPLPISFRSREKWMLSVPALSQLSLLLFRARHRE